MSDDTQLSEAEAPRVWWRRVDEGPEHARLGFVLAEDPSNGMLLLRSDGEEGQEFEADPAQFLVEPYVEPLENDLAELDEVTNVLGAIQEAAARPVSSLAIGSENVLVLEDGDANARGNRKRKLISSNALLSEIVAKSFVVNDSRKEATIGIIGSTARTVFSQVINMIEASPPALEVLDILTRRVGGQRSVPLSIFVSYRLDSNSRILTSEVDSADTDFTSVRMPADLEFIPAILSSAPNDVLTELHLTSQEFQWLEGERNKKSENATYADLIAMCTKTELSLNPVHRVAALLLHLSNVSFVSSAGRASVVEKAPIDNAASILGVETKAIEEALCGNETATRSVEECKSWLDRLMSFVYRSLIVWVGKHAKRSNDESARHSTVNVWVEENAIGLDEAFVRSKIAALVADGFDETEASSLLGLNRFTSAKRSSGEFESLATISLAERLWRDLAPLDATFAQLFQDVPIARADRRNQTTLWVRTVSSVDSTGALTLAQRSQLLKELQSTGVLFSIKLERTFPVHEAFLKELEGIARVVRAQDEFDSKETARRVLTCYDVTDFHFGAEKVFFREGNALERLLWARRIGRSDSDLPQGVREKVEAATERLRKEYGKALFGTPQAKRPLSLRGNVPAFKAGSNSPAPAQASSHIPSMPKRRPGDNVGSKPNEPAPVQEAVQGEEPSEQPMNIVPVDGTTATASPEQPQASPSLEKGAIPAKSPSSSPERVLPPRPPRRQLPNGSPVARASVTANQSAQQATGDSSPKVKDLIGKLNGGKPSSSPTDSPLDVKPPSALKPSRMNAAAGGETTPIAKRKVTFRKTSFKVAAITVLGLIRALKRARAVRSTIGIEGYIKIGKSRETMAERYCVLQRRGPVFPVELFCFTSQLDAQRYFFSYKVSLRRWEADVDDSWGISECIQAGSWLKLTVERTNAELWIRGSNSDELDKWERALIRLITARRRSSVDSMTSELPPPPPLPAQDSTAVLAQKLEAMAIAAEGSGNNVKNLQNHSSSSTDEPDEPGKRSSLRRSGQPLGGAPPARPPPRSVLNQAASNVLKELVDTERSYVNDLHDLLLHYRRPLELELTRDEHKAPLSNAELTSIFGNVAQVLKAHQELLNALDEKQALLESFAQGFVEMMPFLKGIYTVYVQNYPNALSTLAKCLKQRSKFANFVQGVAQSRNCPDLESYLIKPIQRLCKYPLFMKQLEDIVSKEVGQDSTLLQTVREASSAVNRVATEVNLQQRDAVRNVRGMHLAAGAFEGLSRNLCEPGRTYLDEFVCEVTRTSSELTQASAAKTKLWHAFLFSDALIFAKKTNKDDKYRFRAWLDLEHVAIDMPIKNGTKAIDVVHYPYTLIMDESSILSISSPTVEDSPSKKSMNRRSGIFKKLSLAKAAAGSAAINPLGAGPETIEKFYLEFDKEEDRTKAWQSLTDAIQALHVTRKDLAQRVAKIKTHPSLIVSNEESILNA